MKTSESINELVTALSKMQSAMQIASKSSKGYNYKYADLASVWAVVQEPMTKYGLSVIQEAYTHEGDATVRTRVSHTSGQWVEMEPLIIPMGKKDAHSTGSAITYAKRYQLSAALGVMTDEDDDGAKAQAAGPAKDKPKMKKVPMAKWIEERAEELRLDVEDINSYLDARAAHLKHSVQDSVNELALNNSLFEQSIRKWLGNNT